MASAAQLNAAASIVNGQGLSTNPEVLAAISTYQNQPIAHYWPTIFSSANLNSNIANAVIPILNTVSSLVHQGQFLIDIYPANISPTVTPTAVINYHGGTIASAVGTTKNQALGPFSHGIAGFANTFSLAQGFVSSEFDTSSSLTMLKGKTYGQSKLNSTGVVDDVTNGVGPASTLLANVIASWGTMYDINYINLIADPYVFGQHLLDQGLGKYGNLSDKLTAAGLDVADITRVPPSTTTTTNQVSTQSIKSSVGAIEVPNITTVTTVQSVVATSADVVLAIYKTITGADLAAIVTATGFVSSSTKLTTLADYLDFNLVVDTAQLKQLNQLGVHTFTDFSNYLNNRVKQTYPSWLALSKFLSNVEVPVLNHISTTENSHVLLDSTVATISALTGSGTGPFKNPIMVDLFGAVAGIPYTANLTTINTNYTSVSGTVAAKMSALNQSIIDTYNYYISTGGDGTDESSPGAGDGTAPGIIMTSWVTANLVAVATALNSLPTSTNFLVCQQAYYFMLDHLTSEVGNLRKANAMFVSAISNNLLSFGQNIGRLAGVDRTGSGADTVMLKLITDDVAGDTIRIVVAENNNNLSNSNDPNPRQVLAQSQAQNVPISTYLSQNK